MCVRNNWDKYVTFYKKIAKTVTIYLDSSILLEYIWKMINESHRWTQRLFIYKNLWWLLERKKVY